ncbi:HlyD family secretion protein [Leptothermofonsia sp. ETS-13]|uniref:HlyD family secretion protein n=1 Tax=Leptothermofonsia sp. ETS-13 TaxID=3035696 RepID=UPI003B9F9D40
MAAKTAQLTAAREFLALLNQQLQSLNGQDQTLQTVNTKIASDDVSKNRAGVDAAIAAEKAARLEYERYRKLAADGAVSRQLVEQLQAEWLAAQAVVSQAKAALNSTQTSLYALSGGVPLNKSSSLQEQRLSLGRSIEAQESVIKTLETELVTNRKQLQQAKANLSDRRDIEVTAPFAGVVYTTEHDAGEQIDRPDVLLTLLDCNDLWVETLVNAEQANRIDAEKPVRVQMVGESGTLVGKVELVEAMSRAELAKDSARSLLPTVPSQLAGQPIARVVVRIPPTTQQEEALKLCGVGQTARVTFNMKLL